MPLSKKHYVRTALIMATAHAEAMSELEHVTVDCITEDLAAMFAEDNERFDQERFFAAARHGTR